ncbi:hypothetical protein OSCI_3120010 [Kamptonema sp. PCC 6506]|nr:hypothetical protein OSCI_3120010 [Kamptonema sp. PCC 6506]
MIGLVQRVKAILQMTRFIYLAVSDRAIFIERKENLIGYITLNEFFRIYLLI